MLLSGAEQCISIHAKIFLGLAQVVQPSQNQSCKCHSYIPEFRTTIMNIFLDLQLCLQTNT